MDKLQSLFQSRRFYVAISTAIVAFASEMGADIDPATIQLLIIGAASWIVGDSLRETGGEDKRAKELEELRKAIDDLNKRIGNLVAK